MSDDHFGILQDAPNEKSLTCCCGFFNKNQLKYLAITWAVGVLVIAAIIAIPYIQYRVLPTPLTSSKAGLLAFSEDRARKHLSHMVDVLGSRPFGTRENALTVDYLLKQLERIRGEAGTTRMSFYVDSRPGSIEEEVSGGKYLRMWNHMNNVVVTLKGRGDAEVHKNALLVSAHYDTVTMSPGATDNTQSVACLLETLEVLAHSTQGERDLIVVFVNGEESGLLGASHMLSNPTSFPNVGTFINLDGTPGAKSMLFRSTGGWMDFMYSASPRPLGFVVAQDIFDLGIVRSDTDWSVYKEKIGGLDWATFAHRQTYHTLKDTKIPNGALQYMGENLLAVVRRIIDLRTDDPIERNTAKGETHVYWSFLNAGFAVYSKSASLALHCIITALIVITMVSIVVHRSFRWKDAFQFSAMHPVKIAGLGVAFTFITFLATMLFSALCVYFVFYVARWFAWTNTPMGVWAFVFPALATFLGVQWLITLGERRYKVVLEVSRVQVLWGHAILACLVLIATIFLSAKGVGSTYLLYLSFSTIPIQLILQHVLYVLGYMSDDRSEYIPLANEERMALLTGNTMGYGMTNNVMEEERHIQSHIPKVDSKTTHFMWFVIFIIGAVPLIFLADILPVLFDFVSSTVPSAFIGMIVGLVVYLFAIQLMPLVRRGGHLGVIAMVIFVVGLACFFSFTMINRTYYDDESPYVVRPQSHNGTLVIDALEEFTLNLRRALVNLETGNPTAGYGQWSSAICNQQKTQCSSPLLHNLTYPTSIHTLDQSPDNYTFIIQAPESQYHQFITPGLCSSFELIHNGTTTVWDLSSSPYQAGSIFELMLINPDQEPWQITFTGPAGQYTWNAGYTKPHALQGFHSFIQNVQKSVFMTLMGTGGALHTKPTVVHL